MKEIHIKIIDKMKSLLFLCFCVAMAFSAMASSVSDTYVIPNPQQMVCGDGHFVLRAQASFSCNLTGTDKDDFVSYVSNSPFALTYKKKGKADIVFKLVSPENAKMKEEAYRLKVTKKGIQAEATSTSGLFYAFQSIVQLARESGNGTYQLPEVTIEDAPRFSYRGMHLDVSRHFYTKEFVKKQIDALARYKLNRFHWHLTDGAGWRIEIKKYPELTRETAYRPFPDWKSWWNGGRTYCRQDAPGASGGYYTQEDVKEIVEYARQRHITVIPEIEMPAHSEEVLAALPQLACGGDLKPGGEFCPGKELTYEFLTNVLKEVMELFPSEYIHIGGDEASTNHWKQCPDCQALMKAEGMKEEGELQEYLVSRIEKFLKENGRKMIGWDEILTGELDETSAVTVWRGEDKGAESVKRGLRTILSPGAYCYFDSYQDAPRTQPEAIGGYLPLEKVYSYEPVTEAFPADKLDCVWGVQGNVWTEYIPTPEHAEYMIYPRLLALAEVAWTNPEQKDWKRFHAEALQEVKVLKSIGYHAFDLQNEVGNRPVVLSVDNHLAKGKKVEYVRPYSDSYPAGGESALTNGIHGGWVYTDQRWQGFLGKGADVIVDMEKSQSIQQLSIDFMQLRGPGVFLPQKVSFLISNDGKEYTLLKTITTTLPITDEQLTIQTYDWTGSCEARYVRVQADINPEAGGFLFTDEFVVK